MRNGDPRDFVLIAERKVTSRQDQVCWNCREVIPAGTAHTVTAFREEGRFDTTRTHGPWNAYPVCPKDIEAERQHAQAEIAERADR